MKIVLTFIFLLSFVLGQQINSTWGTNLGGANFDGSGKTYLDTTRTTTFDLYFDIDDFYWADPFPYVIDSIGNTMLYSERAVFGTFYGAFDTKGTKTPTADSVCYTIKAYPGVYTTASKALASADWGTAVTLETVACINDYFSINNVYVHATKYKHFPPEVIKIEIAVSTALGADDSTFFAWRYRYPAIYKVHDERK
jgi:hypothetical protein